MKKVLYLLMPLFLTSMALADPPYNAMRTPGFYVTAGLGLAQTNYETAIDSYAGPWAYLFAEWLMPAYNPNNNLGGKISVGYIWNRNFDTEVSYYDFSGASTSDNYDDGLGDSFSDNYSTDQQALAISVVGRLPVGSDDDYRSDFYGKLGLAYTWVNFKVQYDTNDRGPSWNHGAKSYDNTFTASTVAPLAGLGYELNFGQNWAMSFEVIQVFSQGKSLGDPLDNKMSDARLWSMGVTYKFV